MEHSYTPWLNAKKKREIVLSGTKSNTQQKRLKMCYEIVENRSHGKIPSVGESEVLTCVYVKP